MLRTLLLPHLLLIIRLFSSRAPWRIPDRAYRGLVLVACIIAITACEGGTLPDLLGGSQEETATPSVRKIPVPLPSRLPGSHKAQDAPLQDEAEKVEEARLPPSLGEDETDVPPAGSVRLVSPSGAHGQTRVAILLPLSGPHAALGNAMLYGAEMALFDLAEKNFSLLPFDTIGTPLGARRAAEQALRAGAELILGPLYAASVEAAAPKAREKGVPVVAFSTERSVAGNGVFLMGFLPRDEIERVAAFAHSRGLSRFAALVPDTAYGRRAAQALREAVARQGGEVVKVASFPPDSSDVSAVVRHFADYDQRRAKLEKQREDLEKRNDEVSRQALKRLEKLDTLGEPPFDAVLLPGGGDQLRTIAPLLSFFDIDMPKVRLLGTTQWDNASLGTEPALVGGWFAASPPKAREDFSEKFKDIYGLYPPRLATLAYDAAALAAVLALSPGGADFSPSALTAVNGFAGLDGIFRIKSNGIAERGLAVLEMRRDRFHIISPAPEFFK
jgi:ABC-type branched-subunit amino acid transport system substrate-binding protein